MKSQLLFYGFLFCFAISNAQNTAIPDPNFEQAIIDLGYDVAPIDGFVPTAQIDFISSLNLTNRNIEDLTGIEDFASLSVLECGNNKITSLNLSNNTILTQLNCEVNNLYYLNVKNGMNSSFTTFKVFSNPDLTCIEVDDAAYSTANWASGIDPQMSFSEDCYTSIPDANFEQTLIDLGYDNVIDGLVLNTSINTVTTLNLVAQNISDLTGIEGFVSLNSLSASVNQLTSIDLSGNTSLTVLYLNNNQITNLDVSNNLNLIELYISNNQLTNLNVSNNSALEILRINNNQITELDLSQNTALTELYAYANQLISLNIKNDNNTNITYFNTNVNTTLYCIEVDDATYSTTNWINTDAQTSFSQDCHYGETYVPDDNFEQALIDLGYDSGPLDDYVPTVNIQAVALLNVFSRNISDFTGIEDFTALDELNCYQNNLISLDLSSNTLLTKLNCNSNNIANVDVSNNALLTQLVCSGNNIAALDVSVNKVLTYLDFSSNTIQNIDLSNNPSLTSLYCHNNDIPVLDVSNNLSLTNLWCQSNDITFLDLSNHTSLIRLRCENNELTSLNVKNGNNSNYTQFNATNNPDLLCIEVDTAAYSTTNWTNIDAQTSFSEDCSSALTYVPDDNFEQALIDLGYDSGPLDDYVPTANIEAVTSLDIYNKNIADLTGIEDFVALETLYCQLNQLDSIDITNNVNLINLTASYNQITTLNLTQNTTLTELFIGNNLLETIDVSQNLNLIKFYCQNNQLTSLDVSLNSDLQQINVNNNQLSTLNVKNGNNTNFTSFNAQNNPDLTCIEVDDAAYSTANWTDIDAQTFREDCELLSISDLDAISIKIYPNPVSDVITVSSVMLINSIDVYDMLGKKVVSISNANHINVSQLIAGVYFVKIKSNAGEVTKKIIKN